MNQVFRISAAVTLILGLVLLSTPGQAKAMMRVKLGVVTKPGSAQNVVADKFKHLVLERSGGGIQVVILHSASLGNETDILQQVQMNAIQLAVVTGGSFDSFDPATRVFNYPFLFKDHAQADAILDGPLGAEILNGLESTGFKGLAFSENGFRHLTTRSRPVTAPSDLKGLRIRVMASPLHKAVWQALGAVPVPIPWPIYGELAQGVIDGQENPLWVVKVYRFHEIQTHLTLTRHIYSYHIDVASLKWWQTLSEKDRNLILSAMQDAARFQRADNRSRNKERLHYLREKGMHIEYHPNHASFRSKTSHLKELSLFTHSRVAPMLKKLLQAVE